MAWHEEWSPYISPPVFPSQRWAFSAGWSSKVSTVSSPWACAQRLKRSCKEPAPTSKRNRVLARNELRPNWITFRSTTSVHLIGQTKQAKGASHLSWGCWSTFAKDWHRCFHTWWYRLPLRGWLLIRLLRDRLETKTAEGITKILCKPFSSQEFRKFAARYEFEVITSSPGGYPQSNGKVENAIRTAKSIMKKAKQAGTDIYLSLLH